MYLQPMLTLSTPMWKELLSAKNYVHFRGHSFDPIFVKLCNNVNLYDI